MTPSGYFSSRSYSSTIGSRTLSATSRVSAIRSRASSEGRRRSTGILAHPSFPGGRSRAGGLQQSGDVGIELLQGHDDGHPVVAADLRAHGGGAATPLGWSDLVDTRFA